MTKEEIIYWAGRYDKEKDLDFPNFEKKLSANINEQKILSKFDIIDILRWKFQGSLRGRGEYFIEKLNNSNFSDLDIQNKTQKVFLRVAI